LQKKHCDIPKTLPNYTFSDNHGNMIVYIRIECVSWLFNCLGLVNRATKDDGLDKMQSQQC